jgi:hypothetical protein
LNYQQKTPLWQNLRNQQSNQAPKNKISSTQWWFDSRARAQAAEERAQEAEERAQEAERLRLEAERLRKEQEAEAERLKAPEPAKLKAPEAEGRIEAENDAKDAEIDKTLTDWHNSILNHVEQRKYTIRQINYYLRQYGFDPLNMDKIGEKNYRDKLFRKLLAKVHPDNKMGQKEKFTKKFTNITRLIENLNILYRAYSGGSHKRKNHKIKSHKIKSHKIKSHKIKSHKIKSHKIKSHKIKSHKIKSHKRKSYKIKSYK